MSEPLLDADIKALKSEEEPQKVNLISLGCARNRVDSEQMLSSLMGDGWIYTDQMEDADAVIVNSCAFIGPAKEESIQTILEAAEIKKQNPDMKLVVTGCLSQRYKKQLSLGLPEVDFFVGTDQFKRLPELLKQAPEKGAVFSKRAKYLHESARVNTLGCKSAYLKLAEGCQHNCSFCIIPAIRGPLRSRPIESVVNEAKQLLKNGVLELNLIAQDLAAYGRDAGEERLLPLLRELVKLEGLKWIRLLYVYPENIADELIEFMASQDKIVKYLDIPVQHANDLVLQRMNRDLDQKQLRGVLARVKAKMPHVHLRTSVMVGFPGETDEDYQELVQFAKDMEFHHLGCFSYSKEEGTVAGRMSGQIDEDVKAERLAHLMEQQKDISTLRLKSYIGQEIEVLVEKVSADSCVSGRAFFQAPEVDGLVRLEGENMPEEPGLYKVRITDSEHYDLIGEVVSLA